VYACVFEYQWVDATVPRRLTFHALPQRRRLQRMQRSKCACISSGLSCIVIWTRFVDVSVCIFECQWVDATVPMFIVAD
jgi:hypothetical protein